MQFEVLKGKCIQIIVQVQKLGVQKQGYQWQKD